MQTAEAGKITKRAGTVGSWTLASRVLGLVRDMVIAHLFGAGYATDVFNMAFTIPNTFRRLVAEGSLTIAFLPVFSDVRHNQGEQAAKELVKDSLGVFPILIGIFVTVGILLARPLTLLFGQGFQAVPGKFDHTVQLTQWLFPYLWCAAMVALSMGILNALKHFAVPAAAPVLFNAAIIVFTSAYYFLYSKEIFAVVIGVLVGGVLQVLLQIWGLKRANTLVFPRFSISPGIKKIFYLMIPTLLGTSIYEINIMLQRRFASFLEEGSVSYLYNADRFTQLPLGVFGIAIATAALPSLADYAAQKQFKDFKQTLAFAMRLSNYIIIPATVALIVLATPIVATVFQHGAFTYFMTQQTASALIFYTVGLGAVALLRLAAQAFFALQDTRTPVACSGVGLMIFLASALALMGPLSFKALALALGLSAWGQLLLLHIFLHKRIGSLPWREVLMSALKSLIAALFMGISIYYLSLLGNWDQGSSVFNIVILAITVVVGLSMYFFISKVIHTPEYSAILPPIIRRLRRTK